VVSPEPQAITSGPDGQMWVAAQLSPFEDSVVLRIAPVDSTSGAVAAQ
jgi:hypothetical protein